VGVRTNTKYGFSTFAYNQTESHTAYHMPGMPVTELAVPGTWYETLCTRYQVLPVVPATCAVDNGNGHHCLHNLAGRTESYYPGDLIGRRFSCHFNLAYHTTSHECQQIVAGFLGVTRAVTWVQTWTGVLACQSYIYGYSHK
jgi:hypothetical protein